MNSLLIDELKQIANDNDAPEQYKVEIDWLKSICHQQKQEWSEEDEKMLSSFLHKVEVCDLLSNKESAWILKKLKSIKPQPQWKPSDEQLRPLGYAIDYFKKKKNDITFLESLYNDLKNLRQ